MYLCGPVQCITMVHLACLTYTVHSVVVHIVHRSRVPGTSNSPKPNFHKDGPGSTGLGSTSVEQTNYFLYGDLEHHLQSGEIEIDIFL